MKRRTPTNSITPPRLPVQTTELRWALEQTCKQTLWDGSCYPIYFGTVTISLGYVKTKRGIGSLYLPSLATLRLSLRMRGEKGGREGTYCCDCREEKRKEETLVNDKKASHPIQTPTEGKKKKKYPHFLVGNSEERDEESFKQE